MACSLPVGFNEHSVYQGPEGPTAAARPLAANKKLTFKTRIIQKTPLLSDSPFFPF